MQDIKLNKGKRHFQRYLLCFTIVSIYSFFCIQLNNAIADEELFGLDPTNLDVVLTPTRLKQNRRDVPASVTVISAKDIKKLGIDNVPEALRLVPGMAVGKESGNVYRIEYHGTNGLVPRRMQILIDGVSYFRGGLAFVFWKELPVDIEDINRIEVTRSPSAASYGANSFFAVVNIITKHPTDVLGTRAKISVGSLNTKSAFFSHSAELNPQIHYRSSLSHRQDSGYDIDLTDNNNQLEAGASRDKNLEDDTFVSAFDFRSSINLNAQSELDIFANLVSSNVDSESEVEDPNAESNVRNKLIDRNLSVQFTNQLSNKNQIQFKTFINSMTLNENWRSCQQTIAFSDEMRNLHIANPDRARAIFNALPATPTIEEEDSDEVIKRIDDLAEKLNLLGDQAFERICGELNDNYKERRVGYEIQDTHVFSSQLRMVGGLGFNRTRAESETILNGEIVIDSQYLFTNIEYQPSTNTTVNIGAMWENEEQHTDGIEYSPRAAFNYHINRNHTLRFVYAEAIRTPDMLEADRDWNYTMRKMDEPLYNGNGEGLLFVNAKLDGMLRSEKIRAREISYYASLPEHDTNLDIKLFREDLSDLISEKLAFLDFKPSNNNTARLQGIELQLEYQPKARLSAYVAYAYMDNKSTNLLEKSLFSRHSGSAFISYRFSNDWTSSLAYYGSNSIGGSSYDRFDFNFSKSFNSSKQSTWELSFKIQHYGSTSSAHIISEGEDRNRDGKPDKKYELLEHEFDSDTHYFLSLSWNS